MKIEKLKNNIYLWDYSLSMLYAIVDIETTGSYANGNGITEIAIVTHDGEKVIDCYETLVNPNVPIPYFIQRLTGINNEMIASAPSFHEIAGHVNSLLQDKIFVAHNVNFDYSFVKNQLKFSGYDLNTKKLCTVRLARNVLPGMGSYSLGKLTNKLGINHTQAHRAGGDALATAHLLSLIIEKDTQGVIKNMLKGKSKESYIPQNLPVANIDNLPETPGVYYFIDAKGKTIYVGKAKNLNKRVKSHFTNNKTGKQKQDFLKDIYNITYKQCATELMARIIESYEIRKLWPKQNKSQKGHLPQFALLFYEDLQGYLRFTIERNKAGYQPLFVFNTFMEGQRRLIELIKEFGLCSKLCNIHYNPTIPMDCDCMSHPPPSEYNTNVQAAIQKIRAGLPSYAIIDRGFEENEFSCILILNGCLYGLGYIHNISEELKNVSVLKQKLEPIQDNDFIRYLLSEYITEYPDKCYSIKA